MKGLSMKSFRALIVVMGGCLMGALAISKTSAQVVIASNSFYEETKSLNCAVNGAGCNLEMTPLPSTGSLVLITKLNCRIETSPTNQIHTLLFAIRDTSQGPLRRIEDLPIPTSVTTGSLTVYHFSVATDFLFGHSKIPAIIALWSNSAANPAIRCKITGRLQP
jgi:hypothetical protein